MTEWNFGRLSGRQLTLRWYAPYSWWGDAFSRWGYDFQWVYHLNNNHRCYCAVGTLFDGRLCIAGWGVSWFYSHFTGEVPCVCDRTMAELFPEEQG
jgi:hypothetical protein